MRQIEEYTTKIPYTRDNREANREDVRRLYNLFKTDLRSHLDAMLGTPMTDKQFEAIFLRAWESGHAEGYQTVVFNAEDLIEVAREFVVLRDQKPQQDISIEKWSLRMATMQGKGQI